MGITAKELRKSLSPDVAALSAAALAELDGRSATPAAPMAAAPVNALAMRFEALWQRWDGPPLAREYKFSAARRWRLDYFCEGNGARIGIELEGGIYSAGRHVRATGYRGDIEKYNAAAMAGITVLRLSTGQVDDAHVGEIADWVRKHTKGATP